MEDLRAPAQSFLEGGRAHGHDHELLRIHRVGGVCAAVQNVHHGHGQAVAVHTAQKAVQRHIQRSSGCTAGGNGHGQNGVCAQIGFIFGAVGPEHGGINGIDVGGIHAHNSISNDGVDVLHGLADALAQIAALVAVPQLQSFKLTSGCAGRCAAACHSAVGQSDLRFHGGVAAGVQDLAANNRFNFQIVHLENLLNIISFPVLPGAGRRVTANYDSYV